MQPLLGLVDRSTHVGYSLSVCFLEHHDAVATAIALLLAAITAARALYRLRIAEAERTGDFGCLDVPARSSRRTALLVQALCLFVRS